VRSFCLMVVFTTSCVSVHTHTACISASQKEEEDEGINSRSSNRSQISSYLHKRINKHHTLCSPSLSLPASSVALEGRQPPSVTNICSSSHRSSRCVNLHTMLLLSCLERDHVLLCAYFFQSLSFVYNIFRLGSLAAIKSAQRAGTWRSQLFKLRITRSFDIQRQALGVNSVLGVECQLRAS
jgi:hypothetical protein